MDIVMTKEEIIKMLRASCDKDRVDPEQNGFWVIVTEELEAFAKLVAEKAIEEALAQSEQEPVAWEQFYPDIGKPKFVAQPEQEPVAWMNDMGTHIDLNVSGRGIPLYTTPLRKAGEK